MSQNLLETWNTSGPELRRSAGRLAAFLNFFGVSGLLCGAFVLTAGLSSFSVQLFLSGLVAVLPSALLVMVAHFIVCLAAAVEAVGEMQQTVLRRLDAEPTEHEPVDR